ncbi:hypothetical protein Clacol_008488 [Clathrus columnatus]|uniref:Extracellular metalloproteinase n=1 Tax=Clathrus columnatus TaxID=1419009 RepID=A0AAV5APC4_9AGAM|nr:hypothetical protein Clacol_008488 [Clathrus columnatus]
MTYLLKFAVWTGVILIPISTCFQHLSHRKSLSFTPSLAHSNFVTSPPHHLVHADKTSSLSDPFSTARSFLDVLLKDLDKARMSYVIRNDSYSDTRTGVTHIYVKQIVDDFEVTNGLININVKDNTVLSYGDSFFRGPVMLNKNVTTPSVHQIYCDKINKNLQEYQRSLKFLNVSEIHSCRTTLPQLQEVYEAGCHFLTRNISMDLYDIEDPRPAVLAFMVAATPSVSFADKLASNFDQYLSEISVIPLNASEHRFELKHVPGAVDIVPIYMAYSQVYEGEHNYLKLVWKFEVEMQNNWYEVAIDAFNPSNIISVTDWVWDSDSFSFSDIQQIDDDDDDDDDEPKPATYLVYKWGINDPGEGNRTFEREEINPQSSPTGWQDGSLPVPPDDSNNLKLARLAKSFTTVGNNVYAQEDWDGNRKDWINNARPTPGESLDFNYTFEWQAETQEDPLQFARSFMNASITQLFYTVNKYHDFLYLYGFNEVSGNYQQNNFGRGGLENDAVIANGQDGAEFNYTPDGQSGILTMSLWDLGNPYRDADFDAGIVIHEYTHGLASRLTGGPSDVKCLTTEESRGMGEGWGDWFATTIRSKPGVTEYTIGAWTIERASGVWAEILWVVEARDAIIQADQVLTEGENYCALWAGFADRGLGVNATPADPETGDRTEASL